MTKPQPDISIVVPVYNSASLLPELYERLNQTLQKTGKTYELIFVMDGGDTACWGHLLDFKKADPERVISIRLSKNYGQHAATLCGIREAKGNLVITIDDDLQSPPEEIRTLLSKYEDDPELDLIYGVWAKKKHSFFRNIGSRFLKFVFRRMVNGIPDGSSFRLISRDLADKIAEHNEPFVFIDQIISWYTRDIGFVMTRHEKRKVGRSGYSTIKLIRLALNMIFHYTHLPLRMVTWTGLLGSVISFGIGVFFIVKRMTSEVEIGFTSIIVTIAFATSIILLSLGIVGEYIARIYVQGTRKPIYSIKAKL